MDDPNFLETSGDSADGGISGPFPTLTTSLVDGWLDDPREVPAEDISSGDDIPDVGMGNGGEGDDAGSRASSPSRNRISRATRDKEGSGSARDATSKPPSLDEWTKFFGNVVLKVSCRWYIAYAFRGIDEDMLTDREIDRLAMTDEERKLISTPLAELSNKSKFMRKHGRTLVASGDAFNAMVILGAWMSRVNRIAAKYKPKNATIRVNMNGSGTNGSSRPGDEETNGIPYTEGTTGGRIPNGYPVYNPGSS